MSIFVNFIFYIIPVVFIPAKKHKNYAFAVTYNPSDTTSTDLEYDCSFSKKSILTFGYHHYRYYTKSKYRLEYDLTWSFKKLMKSKKSKNVIAIIEEAQFIYKNRNISNYSEPYITEMFLSKFGIPYVPEGRGII